MKKVKKAGIILVIVIGMLGLASCAKPNHSNAQEPSSTQQKQKESAKLESKKISKKDKKISFTLSGFDSKKKTFVYVDNKKVTAQKLKNKVSHCVNIHKIKQSRSEGHPHRVYFVQYANNKESGKITVFERAEYTVQSEK